MFGKLQHNIGKSYKFSELNTHRTIGFGFSSTKTYVIVYVNLWIHSLASGKLKKPSNRMALCVCFYLAHQKYMLQMLKCFSDKLQHEASYLFNK